MARQVTQAKLLVRMDAGNDDVENLRRLRKKKPVDWIIKRNLRKESEADWLEKAQAHGEWEEPREGKEVYTGETWRERDGKVYRVVFEFIQRTITANGQRALAENESLPPEAKMPLSKPVFRRRLRSVIHDLMYFAARLTRHANRWGLSLWRRNPWRSVWERVYACFLAPPAHGTG